MLAICCGFGVEYDLAFNVKISMRFVGILPSSRYLKSKVYHLSGACVSCLKLILLYSMSEFRITTNTM